ncbi:putative fluoride ion transporter CrcB 2 [Alicyclobacillus contaminans]|uniref:fluoride efflux transporter CrcB n=1 Tax=Alicyclobacillus contaminans TaxID=392016 RepID=UPI0003FFEDCE|nr:fluoride efflux transporter CrcB [Alicyclobacillus contaminans]GMA52104.1 putative fluoride ion transporter CrcB 2 [Alicyclobacillus contaminans]
MSWLWVGGGVVGALLRYALSKWIGERWMLTFPLATLFINVSGSFLLGWFTRWLGVIWPHAQPAAMLLLGSGLCGAYTTFSTFTYECTMLFREGRVNAALWYIAASACLGFAASAVGLFGLPG